MAQNPPTIPTAPSDSSRPEARAASVPGGSRTGCDKYLVGCGLGCGLLLILGVVFAIGASLWVFRPGTQHETTAAVSDASVATMHLKDVSEDPGTQEFLHFALHTFNEANRKVQRENMPENLRWLSDLGNQSSSPAGMNMMLPRDLTLSFEERSAEEMAAMENAGPGDELTLVGAVNFRSFVRPIRWIFGWAAEKDDDARVRPHGEHRLLGLEENAWICFVDGTLYFSGSPSALEAALDRLDRGESSSHWQAQIPAGDWDLTGAARKGSHLVGTLVTWSLQPGVALKTLEDLETSAAGGDYVDTEEHETSPSAGLDPRLGDPEEVVGSLTFGADIRSADAVGLTFFLELESAEWAEQYAEVLRETWERRSAKVAEEGLQLDYEVETDGTRLVGEVDLTGLEAWIQRQADEMVESSRRSSTGETSSSEPISEDGAS